MAYLDNSRKIVATKENRELRGLSVRRAVIQSHTSYAVRLTTRHSKSVQMVLLIAHKYGQGSLVVAKSALGLVRLYADGGAAEQRTRKSHVAKEF